MANAGYSRAALQQTAAVSKSITNPDSVKSVTHRRRHTGRLRWTALRWTAHQKKPRGQELKELICIQLESETSTKNHL